MVYTCAYYPTPEYTLEAAQVAKMDLVCRKLRLGRGERVIEAGCGWGSLALFMAANYGVSVRAFNVSVEQIAYARERAARAGLSDRVEFIEPFVRAWRLCLAGSQVAFRTGSMQLFQVVFARGGSNHIPWTRVSGLPAANG